MPLAKRWYVDGSRLLGSSVIPNASFLISSTPILPLLLPALRPPHSFFSVEGNSLVVESPLNVLSQVLRFSASGVGATGKYSVSVGGISHRHTFLVQVYALCSEGLPFKLAT